MKDITDSDDLERYLGYAREFVVGDCLVYRIPQYNHGWTVERDDGFILLGDGRWVDGVEREPRDVMRFFAYLGDALESAEKDYLKRTGVAP